MSSRPLVVVTDAVAEPGAETKVLSGVADLKLLQTDDESVVADGAADAEVLLVFHTIKIGERTIARLGRCKGIVRCGVGYDNVDIHAAGARGIVVCNVPDYGAEEVADHALMLLLAAARRLLPAHQALRDGTWDTTLVFGAPRMRGQTLGVVGCGRIGTALALRAKALGMRVVAYDPYRPDGLDKALGIERAGSLDELLPQAHFLSLHCPLTRETRHLLNERTLALLPRGAYVVNTARGPCVDLAALARALDDERIRRHPRVVLTPHAAFYSAEGWIEMRTKGAQEGRRLLLGEAVRNPVNLHCLVNPRATIPRLSPPEA